MSYISTLSETQKKNIGYLVEAMNEGGITNPISQASVLAIISKESSFKPQDENMNYSANRIVTVFGLSSAEAQKYANNPEGLANRVYGNRIGNTASGDGYKYRARGYNGLTFKGNYKTYGDLIGVDLVAHPEKANDPKIAGKIAVEFAKAGIGALRKKGKLSSYDATNVNDFKNTKDSTLAFYHVNAGTGNSVSYIKGLAQNDSLGGMTKALARVDELKGYIKTNVKTPTGKFLMSGILLGLMFVSAFILYKKYYKKDATI
jgi:putative chitinase